MTSSLKNFRRFLLLGLGPNTSLKSLIPLIYQAVCVKECPTEAKVDSDEKIDCMVNLDVRECPGYKGDMANIFYDTKMTFNYCIPRPDEAKDIVV